MQEKRFQQLRTLVVLSALLTSLSSHSVRGESVCSSDGAASMLEGPMLPAGNRNIDVAAPVNVGVLDDRTTRYDYVERSFEGDQRVWGTYRIASGTVTNGSLLSPRMERAFLPRAKPKDGNYQYFKGTFRIEDVGGCRGTYIIQAKGKHAGHVDVDPAICLIIARKAVRGGETYFDIYREEITKRGGRFSNGGRRDVKLTTVKKDEAFELEMKTGFSGDPVDRHYVNVRIKGEWFNWEVPSPEAAFETGIRYGAYSVCAGKAIIHITDTAFRFVGE